MGSNGDTGSPCSPDYGPSGNKFTGQIAWIQLDIGDDSHDHLIKPEDRLQAAMTGAGVRASSGIDMLASDGPAYVCSSAVTTAARRVVVTRTAMRSWLLVLAHAAVTWPRPAARRVLPERIRPGTPGRAPRGGSSRR